MNKVALIDLETTGLDPVLHEIIEIGAVVFDPATLEVIDTVSVRVKPERLHDAEPKALAVNGYNARDWKSASDLAWGLSVLAGATHGATFMSYNVTFDWSFIRESVKRSREVGLAFQKQKIDLLSIAWSRIPHSSMKNWSLRAVCAYLGIEPEKDPHRAVDGAEKAFEVYKALMKKRPLEEAAHLVGQRMRVIEKETR